MHSTIDQSTIKRNIVTSITKESAHQKEKNKKSVRTVGRLSYIVEMVITTIIGKDGRLQSTKSRGGTLTSISTRL